MVLSTAISIGARVRDESPIAEVPATASRQWHAGSSLPESSSGGGASDAAVRDWTRGIARGDRAALGALFTARADWMVQQCRIMTGKDEHFALDVLQDAMLRIARHMRPLSDRVELDRYLRSVIRTAAVDRIRADLRRLRRERAHDVPGPSIQPALGDIAELERIVAGLSVTDRDTLLRRIARGLGFVAMAEQEGTTSTVMQGRFRRVLESVQSDPNIQMGNQPGDKPTSSKGQAKS